MLKTTLKRILPHPVRYYLRRIISIRGQVYPGVIPYEPQVQRAMQAHIQPGDTVFDVGAQVGIHAIVMARVVGQKGHVYCFEANPRVLGRLRGNLRANGLLERCTIVHGAVIDKGGTTVDLFVDKRPRMAGAASTVIPSLTSRERLGKKVGRELVPAIALDDYCEATGAYPQFIKIDIEGAEFLALKGAEQVLRARKPGIVLEYGNEPMDVPDHRYSLVANPVLTLLSEIGYGLFDLSNGCSVDTNAYLRRSIFCYILATHPESRAPRTASISRG